MKKAIILARVSTKEQEETGLSIDKIQLPQMRQYAIDNELEVVKEFVFQ
jgi:DNA invertase Pin-like site-specific DNA recombinase